MSVTAKELIARVKARRILRDYGVEIEESPQVLVEKDPDQEGGEIGRKLAGELLDEFRQGVRRKSTTDPEDTNVT